MSVDIAAIAAEVAARLLAANAGDVPQPKKPRKPRKEEKKRIKYLTESETEALFRVITSVRDTAIFRIAYHRGLRASEIGLLQLSDYNARDERLTFRRKKGSIGGEYHVTSFEARALRAWLKVRGTDPGTLFPSRQGTPISQQMLDVLMKKYGAAAGLPREKCHMHSLKHSCGTHLIAMGESTESVQDHLGHRSIASTQVYAKFTEREARDKRRRNWSR